MGRALNKFCECCQKVISGANWNKHVKTMAHLKLAKGKPI